jgi:hypothetical protein
MALLIEEAVDERPEPGAVDLILTGGLADAYVARLLRAVAAARLNALYPPAVALANHLSFLGPTGSSGVHDELRLSPVTGLPTGREVLRVKIDRELAAGFLADAAERPVPEPGSPLARRIAYYSRLVACPVMPVNRMSIDLRRQLPGEGRALFRVVLDRFDLAGGLFARYTILLAQRDSFWRRPHVVVDDADLAAPTEGFRRIVGKFAAHEAELAFILLAGVPGIEVEDVRRCRVGPLLMPGVRGVGGALEALLDPARTPEAAEEPPWILCLPEDRAGVEVGDHSPGDPLAGLYREALSDGARELVDRTADRLGYRVAKSRKFVCARPLAPRLAALCRAAGAPSLVAPA